MIYKIEYFIEIGNFYIRISPPPNFNIFVTVNAMNRIIIIFLLKKEVNNPIKIKITTEKISFLNDK